MAVTVTDDWTVLFNGDSANDQDSDGSVFGNTGQTNTTIKVEGTASNMYQAKGTGVGYAGFYNSGANDNLTSTHLYGRFRNLDYFNTEANDGVRLIAGDAANFTASGGNFDIWTVGGNDTLRATVEGFIIVAVDTDRTPDFTQGNLNLASVDAVGIGGDAVSSSGQNTMFVDQINIGSTITIAGGTAVAKGNAAEVAADDDTNGRMVFKDISGVYYVLTGITYGPTDNSDSYYNDTNQTLLFEPQNVAVDLYTITYQGGTGTNEAIWGSLSGTGVDEEGSAGYTLIANNEPFNIVAQDADIDVGHYGCTLLNAPKAGGTIKWEQANAKSISSTYQNCDAITIRNSAVLKKASITDSQAPTTSGALDFGATDPATNTVRDIAINGGNNGINLTPVGTTTYTLRNITFANLTYKLRIDAAAGTSVTIDILEGGDNIDKNTEILYVGGISASDVTINANVSITYNDLVNGSEVRVYNAGTSTEIAGVESVTGNSFNWSVGSGVSMDIRILGPIPAPPSPPNAAYVPINQYGISFTADTTIGITQVIDRNFKDAA